MRCTAVFVALLATVSLTTRAAAAPVFGYNEPFTTGTGFWTNMTVPLSNPGTGGAQGAGDGYVLGSVATPVHWGMHCTNCPQYTGNWTAAGITHIGVSLNDVGAADNFQIHVSIGTNTNLWQYNVAFLPPHGVWGRFVADLTDGNWTQIKAGGTMDQARQNVTVLLFRHDLAPYSSTPDDTQGDLGIDEITIGDLITPTTATSWGRVKALYHPAGPGR
jgi:hypothetical protein